MPTTPSSFLALRHAAQYVRRFRDRIFVIKIGGELLVDAAVRVALVEQIAVLSAFGIRLVILHGGGSELDELCQRLSIPIQKIAGRRITTPEVMDAAKATFCGTQVDLLADLTAAGVACAGLSGVDGGIFQAHRRPVVELVPDGSTEAIPVDFGLVGDIDNVDAALVHHLLDGGYTPVIASLSSDGNGTVFNTNADTLASELAQALGAEKLFFLLAVPGLLADPANPSSLVTFATPSRLVELEARGAIRAGMRPKLMAARAALEGGVTSVHLVSGIAPDALLAEVFTNEGSGTLLSLAEDAAS
ncbi:MAG: acetylglutamate kinase [Holophaga sp.]|nr:acetylglutamate kinase [Holophaga sp.]